MVKLSSQRMLSMLWMSQMQKKMRVLRGVISTSNDSLGLQKLLIHGEVHYCRAAVPKPASTPNTITLSSGIANFWSADRATQGANILTQGTTGFSTLFKNLGFPTK